ncbi:MAG TPA: (d)CMP kinase [Candidatus Hydrogenedentes bacterium]|nr:(d)CMP kinase [Candidatus Hydrogenedentota bacterium]
MERATRIVAIDGPSGAGKSTVAQQVARALGFAYLDTGAMYRAATWWALERGVDWDDPAGLAACTAALPLEMLEHDGELVVKVDGRDVSEAIRTPEVTREVYRLDQNPEVRERLVALQRAFGESQPTVAEGRDIGTVVFPEARCKIFLDASLDERVRRRAADLHARGIVVDLEALRDEIAERDRRSRERAVSPLRRADDAIWVDTTDMTQEEVVARITALAQEAL